MTVPVTVSEHDLLGLLSIVSDHRADDPGDGLPLSLFEHLMQQVPDVLPRPGPGLHRARPRPARPAAPAPAGGVRGGGSAPPRHPGADRPALGDPSPRR